MVLVYANWKLPHEKVRDMYNRNEPGEGFTAWAVVNVNLPAYRTGMFAPHSVAFFCMEFLLSLLSQFKYIGAPRVLSLSELKKAP